MGREAICRCERAGITAEVKALVEPPHLILRGQMRIRIPIAEMKRVSADQGILRFAFGGQSFALHLGEVSAVRWEKALLASPPSLARKLGINTETTVRMIGKCDDGALEKALAEAKSVSGRKGDVILARVNTPNDLRASLSKASAALGRGVPIWFIYPKGPGHSLNETLVRATALAAGIVDTKVAAVSATLTALRFVKRKS